MSNSVLCRYFNLFYTEKHISLHIQNSIWKLYYDMKQTGQQTFEMWIVV